MDRLCHAVRFALISQLDHHHVFLPWVVRASQTPSGISKNRLTRVQISDIGSEALLDLDIPVNPRRIGAYSAALDEPSEGDRRRSS